MIFNKQKYSILILLFLVVMARCTSPEEYSIIREDILVGSLRGPVTEVSVYELVEGQRELIFTESFDRMKRTSVGRGASAKKSDYERSYYSAEGKLIKLEFIQNDTLILTNVYLDLPFGPPLIDFQILKDGTKEPFWNKTIDDKKLTVFMKDHHEKSNFPLVDYMRWYNSDSKLVRLERRMHGQSAVVEYHEYNQMGDSDYLKTERVGRKTSITKRKYEYDQQGNWIKMETNHSGKTNSETNYVRNIQYSVNEFEPK